MSNISTKKIKICKKSVFGGLVIGFMISLGIAFLIKSPTKKEFVYVNFDKVISNVMDRVSKNNDGAMVTEEIENHKRLFVRTLDEYAKDNNVIVFSSPKPVSGARDATDLLIEKAYGKPLVAKDILSRR